ncbi:hypothetical protein, partial [Nocardia asiatica]|uniref:hypothetical protein n=1 Tax=Nocardia asiatica TaxID=209252 RepID=UPI00313BAB4D
MAEWYHGWQPLSYVEEVRIDGGDVTGPEPPVLGPALRGRLRAVQVTVEQHGPGDLEPADALAE